MGNKSQMDRIIKTNPDRAIILIRLMVGAVFLSEGLQKFIYPVSRGSGRFENMGFPHPEFFASSVGTLEIVCGILIIIGLMTRLSALVMFINITVAIIITKIPIAFGKSFGPFILRELKEYGFWSMAHEIRTDLSMWLGSLFLMLRGGGSGSIDSKLYKKMELKNNSK
jgi:putative oxidoreductase